MKPFDLTPDPYLLIALTQTPLKPLDALSELIDNSVDAFTLARNSGNQILNPLIVINLPSIKQLNERGGILRIRDTGIGMSAEMAEKALKAGFTSNNPYDTLGLFGMGLNIATGKLGSRTSIITARKEDEKAIKVVVDLIKITEFRSFEVIPEEIEKPQGFDHGTIIEIDNWWPEGNPNYGFIRKLVGYGKAQIRKEIGRRYSTILLTTKVRIIIEDDPCIAFEHCVWADSRFVDRREHGKIYAIKRFNEVIGNQTRCGNCFALVPAGEIICSTCDSASLRSVEERIKGWVGIQRYDDSSHFGIDIIRNGRTIRLLEKSAFFDFTDDFGNTIMDYPADSNYGRIVGEVHLDHVPVDFLKQDFQRTSPEWNRAISFLRGNSSLQPTQPGAESNNSPIYMLYQGYRRVRRCGKHDMYMGIWDEQSNGPKRIDRKTEKDYLTKFSKKIAGFYDDAEWWKLVESADIPPVDPLITCSKCGADNLESAEICQVCSGILIGKKCIKCELEIAYSAILCPLCGASQIPEVFKPWTCAICGFTNPAEEEKCLKCDAITGSQNPFSAKYLLDNSNLDEDLSISGCSVKLADGSYSQAVDVDCYITKVSLMSELLNERVPAIVHKAEKIEIFLDKQHPLFRILGVSPQEVISAEVAYFLHVSNARISGSRNYNLHSINNLQWSILNKYWAETLSDSQEKVKEDVISLFSEIKNRLTTIFKDQASELFDELEESEKKGLVSNLIEDGEDLSNLGIIKISGLFLKYIDETALIRLFHKHPSKFFDGAVWGQSYGTIPDIPDSIMDEVREQFRIIYSNCLEDCSSFIKTQKPDIILVKRTRCSLDYLLRKLE